MRPWLKLLPWCAVVWLARKHTELLRIGDAEYVQPFCPGPLLSKADYPRPE